MVSNPPLANKFAAELAEIKDDNSFWADTGAAHIPKEKASTSMLTELRQPNRNTFFISDPLVRLLDFECFFCGRLKNILFAAKMARLT